MCATEQRLDMSTVHPIVFPLGLLWPCTGYESVIMRPRPRAALSTPLNIPEDSLYVSIVRILHRGALATQDCPTVNCGPSTVRKRGIALCNESQTPKETFGVFTNSPYLRSR